MSRSRSPHLVAVGGLVIGLGVGCGSRSADNPHPRSGNAAATPQTETCTGSGTFKADFSPSTVPPNPSVAAASGSVTVTPNKQVVATLNSSGSIPTPDEIQPSVALSVTVQFDSIPAGTEWQMSWSMYGPPLEHQDGPKATYTQRNGEPANGSTGALAPPSVTVSGHTLTLAESLNQTPTLGTRFTWKIGVLESITADPVLNFNSYCPSSESETFPSGS